MAYGEGEGLRDEEVGAQQMFLAIVGFYSLLLHPQIAARSTINTSRIEDARKYLARRAAAAKKATADVVGDE